MKKLTYKLVTKTPIIISDSVGGNNHISTSNYIPGSSVLGMTVGRYLQKNQLENAQKDTDFKRLFLSDQVMFLNAYLEIDGKRSTPVPMNLPRRKSDPMKYIDIFISNQPGTKFYSGFTNNILVEKPKKCIHFHTSRKDNRLAGKSVDGGIFTYEGLAENQIFAGEIIGEESDLEIIKTLFNPHTTIRLGRSKTAQYGECEIIFDGIEDFTHSVGHKDSYVLTLNSPMIILNENGASSTLLKDLESTLGKGISINKEKAIVKTTTVETYNRKWGCKRPAETAFAPGSVFEIKVDINNAVSWVESLVQKGLGIRRNEGFGEVSIVEINPVELQSKQINLEHPKPNGHPHEKVAELFRNIIEKESLVEAEQLSAGERIRPKMPNSLTSKLLSLFRANHPEKEIKLFLQSIQTHKDGGESVDKIAAEHLKKVKIKGTSLFDILDNVHTEADHLTDKIESKFLQSFPKEVGISLDKNKIWVHYWKCLLINHMKEKQS